MGYLCLHTLTLTKHKIRLLLNVSYNTSPPYTRKVKKLKINLALLVVRNFGNVATKFRLQTVTVRNFADNASGWHASVPSLGPTGAAEQVYAVTFAPPDVAPSAGSGGARVPVPSPERKYQGCSKTGDTDLQTEEFC
ncbi:hypothetical protein Zmor_017798 [Zophobas morio]|uniref:Uncharacterized protein n=1 Tax=Zophobas morio TaxID=2755281 RepID=A0AA38IAH0_9CUCU|nr:hypothetical protein Zmor_017798 [Zophobas morio]